VIELEYIMETARLKLRKISKEDFNELCEVLQDIDVMYAWEHAFTDEEVIEWIDKNIKRYETDGFSYFAVIKKSNDKLIGVLGPLIEEIDHKKYVGIAYILNKNYWNQGYAIEGLRKCIDYAFNHINTDKIIAQIRPENISSRKVAEKLGMKIEGEYIKHYLGKDMPHLIYSLYK